jgi:PASTA domain
MAYIQQASNYLTTNAASISTAVANGGTGAITPNGGDTLISFVLIEAAADLSSVALSDNAGNLWNIAPFAYANNNATTYPLTFTVAPTGTSATLNTGFSGSTGAYNIQFSDGELRTALLTNGNTAVSWSTTVGLCSGALTGSPTSSATAFNGGAQIVVGFYANNAANVSTSLTVTLGSNAFLKGLLLADYFVGQFLGASSHFQGGGGSVSPNVITSGSVPGAITGSTLIGFSFDEQGNTPPTAGTSPTSFTGRTPVWTTNNSALLEDAAVSSSVAATFGTVSGNEFDGFFTIGMAFGGGGIYVADNAYAFTLEPATLTAGGGLSLALTPLSFAYTLESATFASASTIAVTNLAFAYTLGTVGLLFSSANFEILAPPLAYFVDLSPAVTGNQLPISPIQWQYAVQATAGPYLPVPYVLGIAYQSSEAVLEQYGFDNIQVDFAYDVVNPPGIVFAQSPVAGTPWLPASVVTIVVSQGPFVPATKQSISGLKVTTRQFSLEEMVSREWGSSFRAPDHRIYNFTGRSFDSTDIGTTGIYQRGIENPAVPGPPFPPGAGPGPPPSTSWTADSTTPTIDSTGVTIDE